MKMTAVLPCSGEWVESVCRSRARVWLRAKIFQTKGPCTRRHHEAIPIVPTLVINILIGLSATRKRTPALIRENRRRTRCDREACLRDES